MEDSNISKSSFYPISALDDKANYKRYYIIETDGSICERIFLNILDPEWREHVICMHYLQHYVKIFIKEGIGLNILERDNPWDFKLELSTGEVFNVEITSIADNNPQFIKIKREERFDKIALKEKVPLFELIKIQSYFQYPEDSEISKIIKEQLSLGTSKSQLIDNPLFKSNGAIFVSSTQRNTDKLHSILEKCIQKKHNKSHPDKMNTVLIIDNRTLHFQINDFLEAFDKIQKLLKNSLFREIWLYTGYYTEPDGSGGEFSFIPLKATKEQISMLNNLKLNSTFDKDGIIYT